jgi:hypothetical protein
MASPHEEDVLEKLEGLFGPGRVQQRGYPDFICLGSDGDLVFVEAKCGADKLSDDQDTVCAWLAHAGFRVIEARPEAEGGWADYDSPPVPRKAPAGATDEWLVEHCLPAAYEDLMSPSEVDRLLKKGGQKGEV